jgi:NRAMP (natural resistance-associated macrophage protein)-like metal ion transporter
MKNLVKLALGILTSVGGYLEVGSLGTALQAGSAYRYELLWPLALGTVCIACLIEMSGRLAAVDKETIYSASREHFGFAFHFWPLAAQVLVDLFVLASEVGGASLALELATGVSMRVWALPVAFLIWILLWLGTFGLIENGVAVLGMVTLSFVVAAKWLHPDWGEVARGLIPHLSHDDPAKYAYFAVSILGATISPYMISFYSSGAIEEKWKATDLPVNRATAGLGMSFGSLIGMSVMIVAALTLAPRGIVADTYQQAAVALTQPLGHWGFSLFCASLFVGTIGAALELALDLSYITAQSFGFKWGEDQTPDVEARFALTYTGALLIASVPTLAGIDPLKFTMFSMSLTVIALPLIVAPMLVMMNNRRRLKTHANGWLSNIAVIGVILIGLVLAAVAIPLQVMGN